MSAQPLKVYQGNDGKPYLKRDDHRRYCEGLVALSRPFGDPAAMMVRQALMNGSPKSGDPAEVVKHFGKGLPLIQEQIKPLIEAIEGMLPGFDIWLPVTGFGNDKDFILALLVWTWAVSGAPPKGSERHGIIHATAPPPRADPFGLQAKRREEEENERADRARRTRRQ